MKWPITQLLTEILEGPSRSSSKSFLIFVKRISFSTSDATVDSFEISECLLLAGRQRQHIIALILTLNCWLTRAYTNGLMAELNKTNVPVVTYDKSLPSYIKVNVVKMQLIESASQHAPKMTLTVPTIKVTRFLTLTKTC